MKKIIKRIFTPLLLITALLACEENIRIPEFQDAPNVRIQVRETNNFFNLSELTTTKLVYDIFSENYNDIDTVEISVRYQKAGNPACNQGGCLGPFLVKTYTKSDLSAGKGIIMAEEITMTELLALTGLTAADIGGGDQFLFANKTTMTDGRVYPTFNPVTGQDNVPTIYDTPGASFTGSFGGVVGCPFDINELVGMYDLIVDSWEVAVIGHSEVEIIAGPGENQFTAKNIFGFGFDLVATVNPASGATTAATQETWDPLYWGMPASYGKGYAGSVAANGSTTFSCVGQVNFKFSYTVDAGSFGGVHDYKLLKQP